MSTSFELQAPKFGPYVYATEANVIRQRGIYLLGFEFDGTACFRKGTRLGPDAFREVSEGIESYSPYQDMDVEKENLFDLGNLQVGTSDDVDQNFLEAVHHFEQLTDSVDLKQGIKLITLGGEHSISIAPIKKYLENYDDLVLIHLDAHADLRDGYLGHHFSHASIIRRSLDHFNDNHELIQYGIRSGTKEEYEWMSEKRTLKTNRHEFLNAVRMIDSNRPIYVTLDLDFFDPSFLPGTGTPEAGGEDFHCWISLMKILKDKNFVGADIVELSPEIDSTGNSSVFGTKVLRETIACLMHNQEK